jgi:hypothetical protein
MELVPPGEEMFLMRRMGNREVHADRQQMNAVDAFNKMHSGYRVKVERSNGEWEGSGENGNAC